MGSIGQAAEQTREGAIPHVEPARIGTKGGHDHPPGVTRKTSSAHDTAPPIDARDGMQMAGDLAISCHLVRLVAKREVADRERRGRYSAQIGDRLGIMIAGDPYPLTSALQRR